MASLIALNRHEISMEKSELWLQICSAHFDTRRLRSQDVVHGAGGAPGAAAARRPVHW